MNLNHLTDQIEIMVHQIVDHVHTPLTNTAIAMDIAPIMPGLMLPVEWPIYVVNAQQAANRVNDIVQLFRELSSLVNVQDPAMPANQNIEFDNLNLLAEVAELILVPFGQEGQTEQVPFEQMNEQQAMQFEDDQNLQVIELLGNFNIQLMDEAQDDGQENDDNGQMIDQPQEGQPFDLNPIRNFYNNLAVTAEEEVAELADRAEEMMANAPALNGVGAISLPWQTRMIRLARIRVRLGQMIDLIRNIIPAEVPLNEDAHFH